MKKIFTFCCCLLLAAGTHFTYAYDACIGNLYYNFNETDKTAEVTFQSAAVQCGQGGYHPNCGWDITTANIPSSVLHHGQNYTVTSIGDQAFESCYSLTSVSIPNSVTSIGYEAFAYCSSLTSITIPESVTSIEHSAFSYTGLTSVSIPNSVTAISDVSFYGCTKLATVNIGNSVTSIGGYAFNECTSLTSIVIPNSVVSIADDAFRGCTNLVDVSLGNSVTYLSGFNGCSGLTSVTIPNSVKSIGSFAFYGCNNISSIDIPEGVKTIGYMAFNSCTGLTSIVVPNSVDSIESNAFYGCKNLLSVIIGDSVPVIPVGAFRDCTKLTSILVGKSVSLIEDQAFYNCTKMETITFKPLEAPNITGQYSFANCSSITTINIPCGYSYSSYSLYWSSSKLKYDRPAYSVQAKSDNYSFGSAEVTTAPNCDTYTAELTATPKTGYHFTRWSDNVTRNPYEVAMSKDTVLTAFFEINKYDFKLQANEAARGSVSGVNGTYVHGSKISFEATPNYGYHFTQWSDGIKTNPRSLTIVKDSTITAVFDRNTYTITCGTSAYGKTTGAGQFEYLSETTLEATPNYGYKFKKWSDGITANPRVVRVERDSTITAEYAPLDYQVIVKTADKKMGTVQPNSAEYPYLSQVELTATPKYGYHFTEWSDGSNRNPYTVTITQDTVFTASFAVNTYTINIIGSSYGTATGAGTFNYLTDTQIEAIPNHGYKFKNWSDGISDNPRILTVESDTTLSMVFEPVKYTLRTQSNDADMGSVTPSVGKYSYMSEVEITAVPEQGYTFTQWSDGRIANPRKVTIESDTLFTAIFEVNTFTIQVTSSSMGKISGAGEYEYMSECTLRATANYGYQFTQWSDGVKTNPRKIIVTQDSVFAAVYQPINFTIEAYSANDKQGSVSPETQSVAYQSVATITATGVHGYKFAKWDDGNIDNPRQITVTEDATYIASFERDAFNVTISTSSEGTATGAGQYVYQSSAIIEAVPNYGYQFAQWSDGVTDNPRTIKVEDNITLSMIFEPAYFTIRTQSSNTARGNTSPAEVTAKYQSLLAISAIPEYGYHFSEWNDGNTNAVRTITVTGNALYTAVFEPNTYYIDVVANPSYCGSVYAPTSGIYLEKVEIAANPYSNYRFVSWSDGNKDNPRILTLTQDTALTAVFEVSTSGFCGDNWNLMWEYDRDEKMLTISGNGALNSNYEFGLEAPYNVEKLVIAEGVTAIGVDAFKGYSTLKHISIASTVKTVNEHAFYNCSGLQEIHCYRAQPAMAYSNTFDGIDKMDCKLHVLATSVDMYKVATGWREFYNVESIESEAVTETITDVVTVPHTNDVVVTWPTEDRAETYTLAITKNGDVVCTLIFTNDGRLTGIAFAPGRGGAHHSVAATHVSGGGLRFTVTGLESGTQYQLEVNAKDNAGDPIATYISTFKTLGASEDTSTGIDDVNASDVKSTKIMHNGQLYILRDGKMYDFTGKKLTSDN